MTYPKQFGDSALVTLFLTSFIKNKASVNKNNQAHHGSIDLIIMLILVSILGSICPPLLSRNVL